MNIRTDGGDEFTLSASPDAMQCVAGRLGREWGDYGYTIEGADSPIFGGARLFVRHSDGSRFMVAVDRWGNPRPEYEGDYR